MPNVPLESPAGRARAGGRRPARTEYLNLRVTPDAMGRLDALAEAEDRTRSDMARILLGEALTARTPSK